MRSSRGCLEDACEHLPAWTVCLGETSFQFSVTWFFPVTSYLKQAMSRTERWNGPPPVAVPSSRWHDPIPQFWDLVRGRRPVGCWFKPDVPAEESAENTLVKWKPLPALYRLIIPSWFVPKLHFFFFFITIWHGKRFQVFPIVSHDLQSVSCFYSLSFTGRRLRHTKVAKQQVNDECNTFVIF